MTLQPSFGAPAPRAPPSRHAHRLPAHRRRHPPCARPPRSPASSSRRAISKRARMCARSPRPRGSACASTPSATPSSASKAPSPACPPSAPAPTPTPSPTPACTTGRSACLGGLEAMRSLKESGFLPRRSIETLMFTSEEPTRFGIGCIGSRLLGGSIDPATADALPDRLPETEPHRAAGPDPPRRPHRRRLYRLARHRAPPRPLLPRLGGAAHRAGPAARARRDPARHRHPHRRARPATASRSPASAATPARC